MEATSEQIELDAMQSPQLQLDLLELDVITSGRRSYAVAEVLALLKQSRAPLRALCAQRQLLLSHEVASTVHQQMDRTAELTRLRRQNSLMAWGYVVLATAAVITEVLCVAFR